MNEAHRFQLPDRTYLLSHSVGLLPTSTRSWGERHLFETWASNPVDAWPQWLAEVAGFRGALGLLFNTDAGGFCPQQNVSSGLTKILHAIPFSVDKPVIVLSEEAFPSLGFVCERARSRGYELRFIDRSVDSQDPRAWADHITDDVGVVLITHVHSNSGRLIPAEQIAALARRRGAWSIVDVAQSAGVIPFDVTAAEPDFVVGSSVKWLCGGPGAGFLWVHPQALHRCRPIDVGWFSHIEPFQFDIHDFRFAEDGLRFWGGSPSVAPSAIARRSIELMVNIGPKRIRAHNLELTSRLIEGLDPGLVVSPRAPERRSGTVIVRSRPGLLRRLEEAGIDVDERASGIRVSPHVYNTVEDVDVIVDALNQDVGGNAGGYTGMGPTRAAD